MNRFTEYSWKMNLGVSFRSVSKAAFRWLLINLFLITLLSPMNAMGRETPSVSIQNPQNSKLVPVTFQLRWLHQFQFAGYYAAVEKGFFRQAGFDVTLVEGSPAKNPIDEVLSDNALYAVGNSEILYAHLHGKPLVALAAIFQHSPSIFLARKDSGIASPQDMIGKRVMLIKGDNDPDLIVTLMKEYVSLDRIKRLDSSFDINDLIEGKTDVFNAYITNEPYSLKERGIPSSIIDPRTYGVDFYSDILFTSQKEVQENPKRVRAFREAVLKGWKYAMHNPEELIDIIHHKYNCKKNRDHLQYEAKAMRRLILPDLIEIGHMNPGRWHHMAEVYVMANMAPKEYSLDGFVYDPDPQPDYTWLYWVLAVTMAVFLLTTIILIVLTAFNRKLRSSIKYRTADLVAANMELEQEIASRKRAQKKLRTSETKYRTQFEKSADAIFMLENRTYADCNDSAVRMFGYPDNRKILHVHPADLSPKYQPNEEPSFSEAEKKMDAAVKEGIQRFEWVHIRANGEQFTAGISMTAIPDDETERIYVTCRDLTERKKAENALRESEEKYRLLADNTLDCIWTMNMELEFTYVNSMVLQLFGFTPEEWIGSNLQEHCTEDRFEEMFAQVTTALQAKDSNYSTTFESQILHKDGGSIPVEISGRILFDDNSKPITIQGTTRDITDRKLIEEEKQAHLQFLESMEKIELVIAGENDSEKALQNLLDTVREIFQTDRVSLVYPCNPLAESCSVQTESASPEYPGALELKITIPMVKSIQAVMEKVLELDVPLVDIPDKTRLEKGAYKQFSIQTAMHVALKPKIGDAWLLTMHQCSYKREWTKNEQNLFREIGHRISDAISNLLFLNNLRESKERFRALVETTSDLVWEVDTEGSHTYVSPRLKDLLGFDPEEVVGKNFFDELMPKEESRRVKDIFQDAATQHRSLKNLVSTVLHKNGHEVVLETNAVPIFDSNGVFQGYRGIDRDITERTKAEKALQNSEEALRTIFNNIHDAIFLHSKDGKILDVNNKMLEMYKVTKEQALFLSITRDFTAPNSPSEHLADVWKQVVAGEPQLFEWRAKRPNDGSIFDVEVALHQIFIKDEMVILANVRDISGRKKAEEELRQSRERFDLAMRGANDGLWDYDVIENEVYYSPRWKNMLGYEDHELVDSFETWVSRLHPEDVDGAIQYMNDYIAGKMDAFETEFRMRHKAGHYVYILSRAFGVKNSDGKLVRMVGTHQDISEQKRMEEALETRIIALTQPLDSLEEITLSELFPLEDIQKIQDSFAKATGVASIITDTNGKPLTQPSNFCSLCSDVIRKTEKGLLNCYRSDALIGRQSQDGPIVQPCLSGGLWDAGASITVGGKHIANWLIGQVKNEALDEQEMLSYAKEIGADKEEFLEALGEVPVMSKEQFQLVADNLFLFANELSTKAYQNIQQARFITERKRTEIELRKYREQLETLVDERTEELRQAQEELVKKERLATLGQLTATVSHEIRNPLGTVRTAVFSIGDAISNNDINRIGRALKLAERNIRRCDDIIEELLNFTRTKAVMLKQTQIDQWLSDLLDELEFPEEIHLERRLHFKGDYPIDQEQIRRAIINITTNAIHATKDEAAVGNRIVIETGIDNDRLQIQISDEGCGVPEDLKEKIFEPLYSTKGFGVGLGLPTVRDIMKRHNGDIKLTRRQEGGTIATLWFPILRSKD